MYFILIAIFIFAEVVICDVDPKLDINQAEDDCTTKFPSITIDFLEEIKRAKRFPDDSSRDLKCFIHCVGKMLDKINDDGEYHHEGLKQLTLMITDDLEHDDAHEMVSKCILVEDNDECEKAFKYASCKLEELKSYSFSKKFCSSCS